MAYFATNKFVGDGVTTQFEVYFASGYIDKGHIKAYVENLATNIRTPITVTTGMFVGPNTINLGVSAPAGSIMVIYRDTPKNAPLVDYVNGSRITEVNLDKSTRQGVFIGAELYDLTYDASNESALFAQQAAASAADAAESAALAAASAAAAAAGVTDFKRRWLGGFATNPAVDLTGAALQVGAIYFNTTFSESRVWTGLKWDTVVPEGEPFYPYALNYDIPAPTSTFTIAVPRMVIQFGRAQIVMDAQNITSAPNRITDVWIKPDGTYLLTDCALADYWTLPRYDDYLHLLRLQSSATKVQGVYMRRPTYPIVKRPAPKLYSYYNLGNLHVIPSASVPWVEGPVTLGQVYRSTLGDYWQCELAGVASAQPVGPTYSEENNSGFDLVFSGTAQFSFRGRSTYKGAWRVSPRAGIQWYFAALAAGLLADKFQAETKAFLKAMAFHCVDNWVSGIPYEEGRKVAGPLTQGMAWEALSDGTSTATIPFPAGAAIGDTCTDGTIVWRAIGFFAHPAQKFFWYDTEPTLRGGKSPDSHDSYAACYIWAVWKYLKAYPTDTAWLNEISPHAGYTFQNLFREIIYSNLSTQIGANNLTKTFQQDGVPFGGTYAASFLMDNCEVWAGYHAAWRIWTDYPAVADAPYAATMLGFRDQVTGGLEALWEEETKTYKYVEGLPSMVPPVDGNALFYPLCMSQAWPMLWGVPLNRDRKYKVFEYMEKHYPLWYARNDIDDLLACGAHYAYAVASNNQQIRQAILKRIEVERLAVGQADLYVHDAAYYLVMRDNNVIPPLVE